METRILGIDHGEARVGVAISDDLGMLAHPVETIEIKKLDPVVRISALAKERSVTLIVLGLPRNMDGSFGPAAEKCREFGAKLESATGLKVKMWDERMTTMSAKRVLRESGRTEKNSRGVIDQVAAQVLLQSYLDSIAGMEPL